MSDLRFGPNEQIEVYSESDPAHKFGTLETDAGWHLSFCRAQDGLLINLDDATPLDEIITEILKQRNFQDAQWGGPKHDDRHNWGEWTSFVIKHNDRAAQAISHAEFERQMVNVATLAIAAIESSRRKLLEWAK